MRRILLRPALFCLPAIALAAGAVRAADPESACSLLDPSRVADVQQSAVIAGVPGTRRDGAVELSTCFVRTADFARSVSLSLTAPTGGDASAVRERWERLFDERERAERRAAEREEREAEAESEAPSVLAVPDLGKEAYWIGTGAYGALYVFDGERFFRLSVGGPGQLADKRERTEALARDVLARLSHLADPTSERAVPSLHSPSTEARHEPI